MKLLLSVFEQLSGLKINIHESKMFCYGAAKEWELKYSEISNAILAHYLNDTREYLCITVKSTTMIGDMSKRGFRNG
jgi:hypothetical protein